MLYLIGGLLALLLIIILLLQIPAVQTKITQEVASRFSEQWGTEVSIGKVNIRFFETATLQDVYIEDQAGDTLVWAGFIKADIGAFALFGQRLVLDEVALEDAYINLYRHEDSVKFNYEFIADSFASDTTAADTTSGFEFDLHQARLENVRFRFADDSASLSLQVQAPYLLAELETLGLEEEFIKVSNVDIRNLAGSFEQVLPATTADDTLATAPEVAQELDSAMLNPSGFRIAVEDFTVESSRFHYIASREVEKGTINFENLDLENINIGISDFYLAGDTLLGSVDQLAAIDQNSGFVLENIAMNIALELPMFSGTLKEVITPNTRLTDEIRLEQLSLKPGADMLASLQMSADVENAVISMRDVSYFTPMLDTLPKVSSLNLLLDLDATIEDNVASISPLHLRTEDGGLVLLATGEASGLNDLNTVRFDLQLQELSTTTSYLQQFSFIDELPQGSQQAGRVLLIAQATGTPQNVDFTARMRSGVGLLETNMLYRSPTDSRFILAGNVDATNFNLRPFVSDSLNLGEVSLSSNVRVDGTGDRIDVQKFTLMVSELEYNDYTYEGLAAEGYFVDSVLEVAAAYEDPFLNFDLQLHSDLKDSLPLVEAELNLDKLNMYRLNLSPDSIIVSTNLVASVRGLDADAVVGFVEMRETELIRGAKSWTMDSLVLTSTSEPNGMREISLVTDFMSAELTGKYLFKDLPTAFEQCAGYYCSAYRPSGDMVDYGQEIELDLKLWDEPVIAKAFLPELELLYPLTLTAELRDAERAFNMDLVAPGITWADSIIIRDLRAEATTVDREMSFDVEADRIAVGDLADIPHFALEGAWVQDSVHFDMALAERTDSTHLLLGGAFTFTNDTIALDLDQTDLSLKGKDYQLADNAVMKVSGDYFSINNFALQRNEQFISIDTEQEGTPNPQIIAQINQFQVSDFMDVLGMSEYGLAATLDGRIEITDPSNLDVIEANLAVSDLIVDSLRVGDLTAELNKQSNSNRITTDIALEGPGSQMTVDGYFTMEGETQPIALEVDISRLNLTPWGPFVEEFITDIRGRLSGNVNIAGTIDQPQIDGRLRFSNRSAFRLALTGALYRMENEDYIVIDDEAIRLDNFTLYDSLNQQLTVDGRINHDFFTDYRFNLALDAEDFQVVNKPRDLDAPFFGKLFISADAKIEGPLDDILVTGDLRVNDRTDFAVVIQTEDAGAATASWIDFVDKNAFLEEDTVSYTGQVVENPDSVAEIASTEYFTLRASVEVPSTATFMVVVDPNTGDFMEVKGSADLQVRMEPSGDMNLQGVYEVEEGRYRLSFMEVIQKSFFFEEGSTVNFNGDPLNAELNLTAIYTTEASRLPITYVEPGDPQYAAAKRKEPVNVRLNMEGTLEEPVFTFDITVPEGQYGAMGSVVAQQLDQIKRNESELFRQVFGLIVLNRFLPLEGGVGGGGGGGAEEAVAARVNASLSEFLSEQLNAVTQDYLGVELEVDIESQQGAAGNASLEGGRDVGFSLKRSLFNDKVEVQVGGVTSVGGAGGASAGGAGGSGTQFAGNFAILYHINERGNLNLKIFQRNERDLLTNEFIPKSGVSVSYFKRFNTLNGLFSDEPSRYEMLKSDGPVHTEL